MDDHLIYAMVLVLITALGAGHTWGLGRTWESLARCAVPPGSAEPHPGRARRREQYPGGLRGKPARRANPRVGLRLGARLGSVCGR
jgi:hypothetical protein